MHGDNYSHSPLFDGISLDATRQRHTCNHMSSNSSAVRKDIFGFTHAHVNPLHLFVTTVIQPPEKETRLRLRPYSVRRSVHGAQHLESLRVPHHRKSRHPFRQ